MMISSVDAYMRHTVPVIKVKVMESMDVGLDFVHNCGCRCYDAKASGHQRGPLNV